MTSNNIVILLDSSTKALVRSITYDTLSKHAAVITDIREITDAQMQSTLILFEPALSLVATRESLIQLKEEYEIKSFIVYTNEDAIENFKDIATLVKANYDEIDWKFIYAIANNDTAILEPFQRALRTLNTFGPILEKLPTDVVDYMKRFRGTFIESVRTAQTLLERNADLSETLEVQTSIGRRSMEGIVELKGLLDSALDKIKSYEALLSNSYDEPLAGFYPERPRVLYIKRISHLAGSDILLNVLFTTLTKQYKQSCKVVKLVDSANALDMEYVPNIYVPISDVYNTAEILENDFIMKLGAFNIMFDILMINRSGLNVLIIHDMRGVPDLGLDPALTDLRLFEISADYALLGEYDNALTDLNKQAQFYWSFKECQKFTGTRSANLTNHPTISAILDLVM